LKLLLPNQILLIIHFHRVQQKNGIPEFFVVPGENELSARFDWARVVSRRAERKCVRWQKHLEINDSEVIVYLNRLSDLLWMLAREFENDWTPSK
jgi:cob(I)alamin adenosyltransferase